jgi:hypothetical protein
LNASTQKYPPPQGDRDGSVPIFILRRSVVIEKRRSSYSTAIFPLPKPSPTTNNNL